MKVVVGLGNPGIKYQNTRHNVGFRVVDELAHRHGGGKPRLKFNAEVVEIVVASEKLLLVAPQTFMNASGQSVRRLADFYNLALSDLLVVCDDLNLPSGRLRLRAAGSDGGQKGLKDIICHLGSNKFTRLTIGIDRPPGQMNAADYVLQRFRKNEIEGIDHAIMRAADGVETWASGSLESAMNQINAPQGE